MEIPWLDWRDAAFKKAEKENKPILLDLTAVWCHWCHVMDNTSYEDLEVIKIIKEKFIPVRVDIDKHPIIRDRYNLGGFPTTAFLTPGGDIIGENASAADFFWRFSYLSGKEGYLKYVQSVLEVFTTSYEKNGIFACHYASVMEKFLSGPVQVFVVGSWKEKKTQELLVAILQRFEPRRVVRFLDTEKHKNLLVKRGFPRDRGVAYVCEGESCQGPLSAKDLCVSSSEGYI